MTDHEEALNSHFRLEQKAEQKAKKLLDTFNKIQKSANKDDHYSLRISKECALFMIKEEEQLIIDFDKCYAYADSIHIARNRVFLEKVKESIKQL